jgi:DHA1 family tetracycline resistance protein-like MFS transporter
VFAWSISPDSPVHLPGSAFLLAAGLLATALVVAVRATRGLARTDGHATTSDPAHAAHAAALAVPAGEPTSPDPTELHP